MRQKLCNFFIFFCVFCFGTRLLMNWKAKQVKTVKKCETCKVQCTDTVLRFSKEKGKAKQMHLTSQPTIWNRRCEHTDMLMQSTSFGQIKSLRPLTPDGFTRQVSVFEQNPCTCNNAIGHRSSTWKCSRHES